MTVHFNKGDAKIIKRDFTCQRDNLTIRGTEYRPEGDCLPITIVSHGFMAFQDTVRQYAKAMAEMGYVSYCFDFCGGCVIKGKSDGNTTKLLEVYKSVQLWRQQSESACWTRMILQGVSCRSSMGFYMELEIDRGRWTTD